MVLTAVAPARLPRRAGCRAGTGERRRLVVALALSLGLAPLAGCGMPAADTPLASADADPTVVKTLLEAGAGPGDEPGGSAALTNAVAAGRTETVRALLAKDPGLRVRDGLAGRAALWFARIRGRDDIVALVTRDR